MRRAAGLLVFALTALLLVGVAPEVNAYSCLVGKAVAGKVSPNVSAAVGLRGTLITPVAGEIGGLATNSASVGDLAMTNGAETAFVQFGWYVGGNEVPTSSYLPYTSQPRVFWGENTPSGEQLHAGLNLSWDTAYAFEIRKVAATNKYRLYLQNQLQAESTYAHDLGHVRHVGETQFLCTTMSATARWYSTPARTLQFLYNGAWNYFDERNVTNSQYHRSENLGDLATNWAHGGGP